MFAFSNIRDPETQKVESKDKKVESDVRGVGGVGESESKPKPKPKKHARHDVEELIIHVARNVNASDVRRFCVRLLVLAFGRDSLAMSRTTLANFLYDPKLRDFLRKLFSGTLPVEIGHPISKVDRYMVVHGAVLQQMMQSDPISTLLYSTLVKLLVRYNELEKERERKNERDMEKPSSLPAKSFPPAKTPDPDREPSDTLLGFRKPDDPVLLRAQRRMKITMAKLEKEDYEQPPYVKYYSDDEGLC